MQRSSSTANHGGYFKGSSIFGRSKTPTKSTHPPRTPTKESQQERQGRPSTSSAYAHSESAQSSASPSTFSESRNTSFSSNNFTPTRSPPKYLQKPRSSSFGHSNYEREKRGEGPQPARSPSLARQSSRNFGNPFAAAAIGDAIRIAPRRLNSSTSDSSKSPGAQEREGKKPPSAHQNHRKAEHHLGGDFSGSGDIVRTVVTSKRDSVSSIAPYEEMLARPGTSYSGGPPSNGIGGFNANLLPQSPTLETITYQHIQETSSKRISTLDYLRKAHEGRVYWFNTLLFQKSDLQKLAYFDNRKLARRATNYLLLGLSIPTVMDLNASSPSEYLRTLNSLLSEFESFQSIHPPDGSSSMSRARFPQMFKRATTTATKGRRSSSATEIGLPADHTADGISAHTTSSTSFSTFDSDLLPGEEYTHLLTPSLPFDPDFYETFATLCDVLIDCYTKLMGLVASPRECTPFVAEMFTKADSRVRKIIVQGVVKEFEEGSRGGVKNEVAGVGRVVLGGLM